MVIKIDIDIMKNFYWLSMDYIDANLAPGCFGLSLDDARSSFPSQFPIIFRVMRASIAATPTRSVACCPIGTWLSF